MKKIWILGFSLMMLLSSCEKFLNMPPKNVKVVYTTQDVKEAMSLFLFATTKSNAGTGTAGSTWNIVYFSGGRIQFPFSRYINVSTTMYTDDMEMVKFVDESNAEARRGGQPWTKEYNENKKWEGYLFSAALWKSAYTSVGYLNMVLTDLKNVPDYDKIEYERIAGEARVIRAYYLLKLNQLFAPYDKNDFGIPMNLDSDVIGGGARWKQTAIYEKLIGELKEVLQYETLPKDSWNIFYNKKVIYGILAQTYQFKAGSCAKEADDWSNAEYYAKLARDGNRVENTVDEQAELVYVPEDYLVNKPHPFALLRIALLGDGFNGYSPWGRPSKPQQSVNDELFSMYDATDIRVPVYFKKVNNIPYFVKLQSSGSVDDCNESHLLFRMSDLLLIEAEAMARQGKAEALKLLNEFKSSKIPGYAGFQGGENGVLEEILKERRKEFVLE
ncbi:MAG: RagB/SusD family nutrient uptake outer membrane protein, partial [Odoribacter sp.]